MLAPGLCDSLCWWGNGGFVRDMGRGWGRSAGSSPLMLLGKRGGWVHGKSWQIPRPSLWWKSRPSGEGDAEIGAEDTERYKTHRESVSSVHNHYGGESYYGYAASNASTSSSTSSNNTPVGSLNSPLVRVQSSRPAWIPTALPPLALDGGLKKSDLEIATVGADHIPKKEEDSQSIASSTHFTVVGGYGGGGRVHGGEWRLKAGKITALVLSMSLLILVGILAAILFLEGENYRVTKEGFTWSRGNRPYGHTPTKPVSFLA
ncbi:hypothetical protein J437_LFUL006138 [Ladona fulva]|uniref:Uncharacterized protein n=1 Tax=Ladona fulva TaxID=123851 RepID=A0A8K0NXR2_LADFU|nr:hypothetical protein J437_LFUL006138 [Ladona fulva]